MPSESKVLKLIAIFTPQIKYFYNKLTLKAVANMFEIICILTAEKNIPLTLQSSLFAVIKKNEKLV